MGRRRGFTLAELLVVVTILGILISLILIASWDGVRRAEQKATEGLIAKLDTAVADRVEALLATTPDLSPGHTFLAGIYPNGGAMVPNSAGERARVLARMDQMRYEMPDVFWFDGGQYGPTQATTPGHYPLNFASLPWPPLAGNTTYPYQANFVPIGTDPNQPQRSDRGVYGASYAAAAGLYKNLGYAPEGYDGQDNNGDGAIDDLREGSRDGALLAQLTLNLQNHTHKTARSEVLYAILVEGMGPLGSVLNREDFTDREVRDTDGDGLPEFVDAWGEPLQFFRWPVHYPSEAQKGYYIAGQLAADEVPTPPDQVPLWPFGQSPTEQLRTLNDPRQRDPLDPNQTLMAPAWWSAQYNGDPTGGLFPAQQGMSGLAAWTQAQFHSLTDMNALYGPRPVDQILWDRGSTYYMRRAYYSRFLILSGGPDKAPGVGTLARDWDAEWNNVSGQNLPGPPPPLNAVNLLLFEEDAAPLAPWRSTDIFGQPEVGAAVSSLSQYLRDVAGGDDVTNHRAR